MPEMSAHRRGQPGASLPLYLDNGASLYRSGHAYGPHDPKTAPSSVTVFGSEREGGDYLAEIPEVLVKQRERLNNAAWLRGLNGRASCPKCGRFYCEDRATCEGLG